MGVGASVRDRKDAQKLRLACPEPKPPHAGSITIVVPDGAGVTLHLASLHGSITSNPSGQVESFRSGERR